MNYLKKKLKPLTSGLTNTTNQAPGSQTKRAANNKDLEEDLYDEYVVEAPPHPSELLALGVEPTEIDVNDPQKLRDLYRKALEEGKDKKVNSVLLAKQRQKEELEEKKRTREEWKFFESLTTRVEQVVKSSQKNLDQWRESSAVDGLTEPDYELHGEVPKSVLIAEKIEKHLEAVASERINQVEDQLKSLSNSSKLREEEEKKKEEGARGVGCLNDAKQLDEFGCPIERRRSSVAINKPAENAFVVNELLEDFGIDLRTEDQRKALERQEAARKRREVEELARQTSERKPGQANEERPTQISSSSSSSSKTVDSKPAIRARPRPRAGQRAEEESASKSKVEAELDPFDTSFVAPVISEVAPAGQSESQSCLFQAETGGAGTAKPEEASKDPFVLADPFDTSHVNF